MTDEDMAQSVNTPTAEFAIDCDGSLAQLPKWNSTAADSALNQLDHSNFAGVHTGPRYEMREEIARGGMGVIYRAHDVILNREVAVKVLSIDFLSHPGNARRFFIEAQIAGQLQHPAIPPVHDLGTLSDGRPFLVMKLIKGKTLEDLLCDRTDPADDHGRFIAAFEQICQAVAYAHSQSVIHRDLKPANIMLGPFGEVQVMDWGLAKVIAADPQSSPHTSQVQLAGTTNGTQTEFGSVMGTPAYMPPEQAVGSSDQIDKRVDVFGLGAILAVILTGRPPTSVKAHATFSQWLCGQNWTTRLCGWTRVKQTPP